MDEDKTQKKDEVTSDISVEAENLDDSVVAEENSLDAVKKLREKLKKCEAEKNEYLTGWQRSKADFINFKKDQEKSREDWIKFANEGLIEDLIPVLDSFEMAFGNKEAWEKVELNWRMGVQYIYSQLWKILEGRGVSAINPNLGEKIDSLKHVVSATTEVSDEKEAHTVKKVIKKGYTISEKVLRPAEVVAGEILPK